ncbi:MAG: hypothetical protein EPN53_09990 [Acidobacteria bacterium]|nr:MAG: hypothetical protein EPN53_09990 [Acidobacteriota bacterium]
MRASRRTTEPGLPFSDRPTREAPPRRRLDRSQRAPSLRRPRRLTAKRSRRRAPPRRRLCLRCPLRPRRGSTEWRQPHAWPRTSRR